MHSLGLRNPKLYIARMLAIYSIHACNSTRAKADLYCAVGFISVIEASRCRFRLLLRVESQSVVSSDCPQCNDLYRWRSFILASLDLYAHQYWATGDVVKLFIYYNYVTIHDKTNRIALGLNLGYEPKKVAQGDRYRFRFLALINRGTIPLHKYLLRSV